MADGVIFRIYDTEFTGRELRLPPFFQDVVQLAIYAINMYPGLERSVVVEILHRGMLCSTCVLNKGDTQESVCEELLRCVKKYNSLEGDDEIVEVDSKTDS